MIKLLLVSIAALALAACGGDDAAPPLKPADEVRATATTQSVAGAQPLGKSVPMGDLTVVVQSVEYKSVAEMANRKPSEDGAAWALVSVRVENPSKKEASALDFNIACADGTKSFRYAYDETGSMNPAKPLPAGSFSEGKMLFSMSASCKGAGAIAAVPIVSIGNTQPIASWKLP